MLQIRDSGGTLRTILTLKIRDAEGTLRSINQLWARDASNTLRNIFSAFGGGSGVTVSPTTVKGYGNSSSPIAVSTGTATVSVAGGAAPYTYAWTQLSGTGTWSANNPSGSFSAFRRLSVPSGGSSFTSTWKCTVTDANGLSSDSPVVTATVQNLFGA